MASDLAGIRGSKSRTKPTAIDLFSGCGGLSLGLRRAGFRVIGAVEIDPLPVETYRANHRGVRVWQCDIRALDPNEVARELDLAQGELDLLAGCPPCQGFSVLRTRNGAHLVADPRNDLLFEFLRFAEALLPKIVMMENVSGMAHDKRFTTFCERLHQVGYEGHYEVLNVADYGVPQRRRRLLYVAGLGIRVPFCAPSTERTTVRDAIGLLPKAGESGDPMHDMPEKRSSRVMNLIRHIPKDGGSRTDLPEELQLACHRRCNGFRDVYGRMAWDEVAPTITGGCFNPSKGRFLHPEEDRTITMREAALLQGFPKDYRFPCASKSTLALMIGNALPPPFVAAHARCVRQVLDGLGRERGERPAWSTQT